jgi:hypothetical protein
MEQVKVKYLIRPFYKPNNHKESTTVHSGGSELGHIHSIKSQQAELPCYYK